MFALTVMYSFNAANDRIEDVNQQQVASEKLYLNIEKVNETIRQLVEENKSLQSKNGQIKEENNQLILEISQFNASMQPTADASVALRRYVPYRAGVKLWI
jgi:predicted RNase H-like nuclease (RuvC/YqgF family)